ncbi:hypothetical protein IV102_09165 [bacterium]|nr:hypothetical protein [bacterium]
MKALLALLLAWLPAGFDPSNWESAVNARFGRGQESYRPASAVQMDELRVQAAAFPPIGASLWDDTPTYLVQPSPDLGWGLLLRRPRRSGWILEVPHPVADRHTSTLAWQLFQSLPFDALILGGCHRLNRADGSSDLAHTQESAFMAWHQALAGPDTVVIQLHGFDAGKERARTMPPELLFVLADGSGQAPDHGPAYRLYGKLCQADWPGRLAGPDAPWLMATTNAQRSCLNGAQFVHLELDSRLRQESRLPATLATLTAALGPLLKPD